MNSTSLVPALLVAAIVAGTTVTGCRTPITGVPRVLEWEAQHRDSQPAETPLATSPSVAPDDGATLRRRARSAERARHDAEALRLWMDVSDDWPADLEARIAIDRLSARQANTTRIRTAWRRAMESHDAETMVALLDQDRHRGAGDSVLAAEWASLPGLFDRAWQRLTIEVERAAQRPAVAGEVHRNDAGDELARLCARAARLLDDRAWVLPHAADQLEVWRHEVERRRRLACALAQAHRQTTPIETVRAFELALCLSHDDATVLAEYAEWCDRRADLLTSRVLGACRERDWSATARALDELDRFTQLTGYREDHAVESVRNTCNLARARALREEAVEAEQRGALGQAFLGQYEACLLADDGVRDLERLRRRILDDPFVVVVDDWRDAAIESTLATPRSRRLATVRFGPIDYAEDRNVEASARVDGVVRSGDQVAPNPFALAQGAYQRELHREIRRLRVVMRLAPPLEREHATRRLGVVERQYERLIAESRHTALTTRAPRFVARRQLVQVQHLRAIAGREAEVHDREGHRTQRIEVVREFSDPVTTGDPQVGDSGDVDEIPRSSACRARLCVELASKVAAWIVDLRRAIHARVIDEAEALVVARRRDPAIELLVPVLLLSPATDDENITRAQRLLDQLMPAQHRVLAQFTAR